MRPEEHLVYEFDGFRLDPRRRLLSRRDGEPLPLTAKAFDALIYFVEHAGRLVTREELTQALWPATIVEENNLSQAISVLRRTLGEGLIATVARRGYQFTADVRVVPTEPANAVSGVADASVPASAAPAPVPAPAPTPAPASLPPAASRFASRPLVVAAIVAAIAALGAVLWLVNRPQHDATSDSLARYAFSRLTEFEGPEEQAAISRDGRFVAFLRERDGQWDAWVGQIGTGEFQRLTHGSMQELRNPAVRALGFSPNGANVVIWTRTRDPSGAGVVDAGWTVPTLGGDPKPYLRNIAELDWSPDGKRIAYHTAAAGDPVFVADADDKSGGQQVHVAAAGLHNHFPLWSRDARFIYFVHGYVPDEMDLWRVPAGGGSAERLTFHNSRVSFPAWLDERTLLYLATAQDGSGPWLYVLDPAKRAPRRLDTRGREYASIAASDDGRRLVATEVRSTASLWRATLRNGTAEASEFTRLELRTPQGLSPRISGQFIIYRAPGAGRDGLYKLEGNVTTELWSGAEGRVTAGAAIAPDAQRLAFAVEKRGRTHLYVVNIDGSGARKLAAELDVRGAPAWSPDGKWLAIGAMRDDAPRLFRIPSDGGAPQALGKQYAIDPAWSPDGRFIVYSGADVGTNFPVHAVNADGTPHALPALVLSRGSRRLDFLDDEHLVVLKGDLSHKELWAVDLRTAEQRQITRFGPGPMIRDFDISADGRELVVDRVREESDIVLMDRPAAGKR